VAVCVTFVLVCVAWVFFRANTIADALLICGRFAALPAEVAGYIGRLSQTGLIDTVREAFQLGTEVAHPITGFGISACGVSFIAIAALVTSDWGNRKVSDTSLPARKPLVLRWAGYYALILCMILSLAWNSASAQFIYFAF
jgi:hypothetical protein